MDIKVYLKEKKEIVDSFLDHYLQQPFPPPRLQESMKYSLLAGGKRIRPILCLTSHEALGGAGERILPQACALELIHTYSLIHDDLPAMDDDDLRRGKATNHVIFGEAIAILAGDALLTDAFRMFSQSSTLPSDKLIQAIYELASAAGIYGMVAGQVQDIISEHSEPDEETVSFIHRNKTSALIRVSVQIGAILAEADSSDIAHVTAYGNNIGLAFQVIDDILDIEGSTDELGKPRGSDLERQKLTYPSVYGLNKSREIARNLIKTALQSAEKIRGNPDTLVAIAEYLLTRTH